MKKITLFLMMLFLSVNAAMAQVDANTAAAIEKAESALAMTGVGYPKADSKTRTALVAMIEEAKAATTDYSAKLKTALNNFYCETSVTLPETGKAYTFTMVALNGKMFYLKYTGEDIAIVPRTDEALPDSAAFKATDNGDGTFSFQTIDGKYLVYHMPYAGIDWLEGGGNKTGLQDEADKMTKITLAKMSVGNSSFYERAFGKMTWYSMRGFDTSYERDVYGYLTLKADGSDYDNAEGYSPFWNNNFSAVFQIEEVESTETVTATTVTAIDPACGHYEVMPATVKVTFNQDIKELVSSRIRSNIATDAYELTAADYTIQGKEMTINVPAEYADGATNMMVMLSVLDMNDNKVTYADDPDMQIDGNIMLAYTAEEVPEKNIYEPLHNGTKITSGRNITAVKLTSSVAENVYELTATEQGQDYTDATATTTFQVLAGEELTAVVEYEGTWMHHAVFVDFDADGFTGGLVEGHNWKPAGDLVAYSFYNSGNDYSDETGYNSAGKRISGNGRANPEIPAFTAPEKPGIYRMRFMQDWCSLDPAGDNDGKFGDFKANGGQIVDVILEVGENVGINHLGAEKQKEVYTIDGRKVNLSKGQNLSKGLYIVGGKKTFVR